MGLKSDSQVAGAARPRDNGGMSSAAIDDALLRHCRLIQARLAEGKVIPFLGAGANLCGRPADATWRNGYLPSGSELAAYLAREFQYPEDEPVDLVRVSQYVDLATGGEAALFEKLHALFAADYEPNMLHHFLATQRCSVIVTTNYDDALERAFASAGRPLDVVSYFAPEPDEPGRFLHTASDGKRKLVPRHTDYRGLDPDVRPVLLKIHGAVDRDGESGDSYVITEDHYIDFLAHTNLSKLIPASLMARMRTSHFLFLGYGMRDWNLRVILHHVWAQQVRRFGSWAVRNERDEIEERFWQRHRVEIVRVELEDWVAAMTLAAQ
jgi:hypothetical protein